jgi:hypothetical protein
LHHPFLLQQVEIKIRGYSEAGYPVNPITSDWSSTITVVFPTELLQTNESTVILESAVEEESRIKFQEELSSNL